MTAAVLRSGVAVEPETEDRWRTAFYALITFGILLGFGLGVREVVHRDPVRLGTVREGTNEDGTPRAQVLAKNYSSHTTYCVIVRITAADRDGLTLATAIAAPLRGEVAKLQPGESLNLAARLPDLTAEEIDQKLSDYFAFVIERQRC
jgi:hypothetical protein